MESANGMRMECLDLIGTNIPEQVLKDYIIKFCLHKGYDAQYIENMLMLARMSGHLSDTEYDPEHYEDLDLPDVCPELAHLAGTSDICNICKFSLSYTNHNIHPEYIVLSYALKSRENRKEFIQTGLGPERFVSYKAFDGAVIPIHRIICSNLGNDYETTRKSVLDNIAESYPNFSVLSSDVPTFLRHMHEETVTTDKFFSAVNEMSGAPSHMDEPSSSIEMSIGLDVVEISDGLSQYGISGIGLTPPGPVKRKDTVLGAALMSQRKRKPQPEIPPLPGQTDMFGIVETPAPDTSMPFSTDEPIAPPLTHVVEPTPNTNEADSLPRIENMPIVADGALAAPVNVATPLPAIAATINEAPLEHEAPTIKLHSTADFHRYLSTIYSQSTLFIEAVGTRLLLSWGNVSEILEVDTASPWVQVELSYLLRSSIRKITIEPLALRSLMNRYGIPCRSLDGLLTLYHCWRYTGKYVTPAHAIRDLTGLKTNDISWYNQIVITLPYYMSMWKSLTGSKITLPGLNVYEKELAFESLAATGYRHDASDPYPRQAHFVFPPSNLPITADERVVTARCLNVNELFVNDLKSPMGHPYSRDNFKMELYRRVGADMVFKDILGHAKVRFLDMSEDHIRLVCPESYHRVLFDLLNQTLDARIHDVSPGFKAIIAIE